MKEDKLYIRPPKRALSSTSAHQTMTPRSSTLPGKRLVLCICMIAGITHGIRKAIRRKGFAEYDYAVGARTYFCSSYHTSWPLFIFGFHRKAWWTWSIFDQRLTEICPHSCGA